MVRGTASIRGTFFGFLLFGLSSQHLWFRREDDSRKEKIIQSSDERSGHQCTKCGAVLINRTRRSW